MRTTFIYDCDFNFAPFASRFTGALTAFGNALHTVTDRTSPSHAGEQKWSDPAWHNPKLWIHIGREAFGSHSDNVNERRGMCSRPGRRRRSDCQTDGRGHRAGLWVR